MLVDTQIFVIMNANVEGRTKFGNAVVISYRCCRRLCKQKVMFPTVAKSVMMTSLVLIAKII